MTNLYKRQVSDRDGQNATLANRALENTAVWKTFQRTLKHIARRRINLLSAPLAYPAGHFYSPITNTRTLADLYRDPGNNPVPHELPGIALDRQKMIALWDRWSVWLDSPRPGTSEGSRYNPANGQFGPGDALVLSFMLRYARPQRLIEIGSGHSSAVSLDTIEQFLDDAVKCTFIDPYPQRLLNLFRDGEQ